VGAIAPSAAGSAEQSAGYAAVLGRLRGWEKSDHDAR
jgi:hypothetical protein